MAKGSSITDEIIRCASVRTGASDWVIDDQLAGVEMPAALADSVLVHLRPEVVGKQIRAILALQIESTVNEYTFTFKVKSVTAAR